MKFSYIPFQIRLYEIGICVVRGITLFCFDFRCSAEFFSLYCSLFYFLFILFFFFFGFIFLFSITILSTLTFVLILLPYKKKKKIKIKAAMCWCTFNRIDASYDSVNGITKIIIQAYFHILCFLLFFSPFFVCFDFVLFCRVKFELQNNIELTDSAVRCVSLRRLCNLIQFYRFVF